MSGRWESEGVNVQKLRLSQAYSRDLLPHVPFSIRQSVVPWRSSTMMTTCALDEFRGRFLGFRVYRSSLPNPKP